MTTTAPSAGAPADPLRALTDQWLDWCRQAGAWSYGHLVLAAFSNDPRQLRSAWLADLTRSVDDCLRSPLLLEWMRSNVGVATRTPLTSPNRTK